MKLLVVGSVNYDLVFRHDRLPKAGESLLGATFYESCGGKGANQAVVAARCCRILDASSGSGRRVEVAFAGAVGADDFGEKQRQALVDAGVGIEDLFVIEGVSTGTSCVWVEAGSGQNRILSARGANDHFLAAQVGQIDIEGASLILMPNEVPAEALAAVAERAIAGQVPMIWNPAPFLPGETPAVPLEHCTFITPNEIEAAALSGAAPAEGVLPDDHGSGDETESVIVRARRTAQNLYERMQGGRQLDGKAAASSKQERTVLVTLGEHGVMVCQGVSEDECRLLPAPRVEAVDTTGAGDALNGAFAAALLSGASIEAAVRFGIRYASESVTRPGTQSAFPEELSPDQT